MNMWAQFKNISHIQYRIFEAKTHMNFGEVRTDVDQYIGLILVRNLLQYCSAC